MRCGADLLASNVQIALRNGLTLSGVLGLLGREKDNFALS